MCVHVFHAAIMCAEGMANTETRQKEMKQELEPYLIARTQEVSVVI